MVTGPLSPIIPGVSTSFVVQAACPPPPSLPLPAREHNEPHNLRLEVKLAWQ